MNIIANNVYNISLSTSAVLTASYQETNYYSRVERKDRKDGCIVYNRHTHIDCAH